MSKALKKSTSEQLDNINEQLHRDVQPSSMQANDCPKQPGQEIITQDGNKAALENNAENSKTKELEDKISKSEIENQKKQQPKNKGIATFLSEANDYLEQRVLKLVATLTGEKEELEEKYKQCKANYEDLELEKKKADEEITSLRKIVDMLYAEQKEQNDKKGKHKRKQPDRKSFVQLFHYHQQDRIQDIEHHLIQYMESKHKDLQVIRCSKQSEIDPSLKLIVLCIISTRVGTDAIHAIKDVQNLENTALVLIHMKEIHSNLTDERLQGLRILDFAYKNEIGLYQCKFNEESFQQLSQFI